MGRCESKMYSIRFSLISSDDSFVLKSVLDGRKVDVSLRSIVNIFLNGIDLVDYYDNKIHRWCVVHCIIFLFYFR